MSEEPSILLGGNKRLIAELPTPVLVALFGKWSIACEAVAMVRELRRRGNKFDGDGRWHGWILGRMNRIDPPPCECGRPGLYLVGITTYCRKCKYLARLHRAGHSQRLESEADQREHWHKEREANRKKANALKSLRSHRQSQRLIP